MAKEPIKKYDIQTKYVDGLPQNNYQNGKGRPSCIVLHDTGNDTSKIDGEITYMSNNWASAFVHAWADADKIVETANTDYNCWGAGPGINLEALQIELVHEHTAERFFRSVDRWIFWAAFQCFWYNIKPSDATDDGKGTIWTHEAVSKFRKHTDHVDPMPYIRERSKKFGHEITWKMIYNKLFEYWEVLEDGGDTRKIKAIGSNIINGKKTSTVKKTPVVSKTTKVVKKPVKQVDNDVYVVREGDSLWKIATAHNIEVDELKKLNGIKGNLIRVGQELKLKKVKQPVTRTVKKVQKAASDRKIALKTKVEMLKFANESVGEYFDYDGAFKFQCFDWANAYWHQMFKHGFTGMQAANIPQNNRAVLLKESTVYEFGGDVKMQAGDVVIWDWDPNSTEDFGHVAVAIKVGTNGMTIVEQNADGYADKPANKRTCNFNGVEWFIRPNFRPK